MKAFKRTPLQSKILAGMDTVYQNLIEYKKMKNSVLVIYRDNKIIKIKP
jgi:hypothetical protein